MTTHVVLHDDANTAVVDIAQKMGRTESICSVCGVFEPDPDSSGRCDDCRP